MLRPIGHGPRYLYVRQIMNALTKDNVRYKEPIFKLTMKSEVPEVGIVKLVVNGITCHGYLWIGEEYIGRYWSMNPIYDKVAFTYNEKNILIHYKWVPRIKCSVYINDIEIGRYKYNAATIMMYSCFVIGAAIPFLLIGIAAYLGYLPI